MPSKKKKYNARFPPARIKKIMQSDEEVGKVAQAVPVIISRALELFVESLLKKAEVVTLSRNAKTLTPSHLKQCILAEQRFDFLKDIVENIPDVQGDEDCATPAADTPRSSTSSSPFVFPTVSRSNSIPGPSCSYNASATTPVIKESPPVIISSESRPQSLPLTAGFQEQQKRQYDSVIVSYPSSSSGTGTAIGVHSSSYIPEPIVSSNSQYQHEVQSRVPVLSHFEYLPNNLQFVSTTPTSNNGLHYSTSLNPQQTTNLSSHSNGPSSSASTGVVDSTSDSKQIYQRQQSQNQGN